MALHKILNAGCLCGLANEVGHVDGEKVAGIKEATYGFKGDVVGIKKVGQLPVERLDGGIGGLARGSRFGADDVVFAIRFVPNGNHFDTALKSLGAGLKLRLGLMSKPVSSPDGKFVQS